MSIPAGAVVRVFAQTERGGRWAEGMLAVEYTPGDSVLFEGIARYGDYDYAPNMIYPVDIVKVAHIG